MVVSKHSIENPNPVNTNFAMYSINLESTIEQFADTTNNI